VTILSLSQRFILDTVYCKYKTDLMSVLWLLLRLSSRACLSLYWHAYFFLRSCERANFFIIKPTRRTNFTNLFWHETLHWINSWWWTEKLPETCTFSCQNKFVKLVHLVGFTMKKRVLYSLVRCTCVNWTWNDFGTKYLC